MSDWIEACRTDDVDEEDGRRRGPRDWHLASGRPHTRMIGAFHAEIRLPLTSISGATARHHVCLPTARNHHVHDHRPTSTA